MPVDICEVHDLLLYLLCDVKPPVPAFKIGWCRGCMRRVADGGDEYRNLSSAIGYSVWNKYFNPRDKPWMIYSWLITLHASLVTNYQVCMNGMSCLASVFCLRLKVWDFIVLLIHGREPRWRLYTSQPIFVHEIPESEIKTLHVMLAPTVWY